jgi:hypothetical protein
MNDPTDVDLTIGRWVKPGTEMLRKPSKTAGSVIFVAMPTKGTAGPTSADSGRLYEEVYKAIARLHEKYPDHTFVAPMVQDYCLLPHMLVEANWEQWGNHCRRLIERCDEVWVLMYEGWAKPVYAMDDTYNTSNGVHGELQHAAKHRLPVSFLEPRSL